MFWLVLALISSNTVLSCMLTSFWIQIICVILPENQKTQKCKTYLICKTAKTSLATDIYKLQTELLFYDTRFSTAGMLSQWFMEEYIHKTFASYFRNLQCIIWDGEISISVRAPLYEQTGLLIFVQYWRGGTSLSEPIFDSVSRQTDIGYSLFWALKFLINFF